ncbi:family 20 glycosylhydrolase [Lutimonas halocynthiae]|uniref:beta-N-acetylhexosaminidase n=1 Tax=Lutimonas halocynthiae TaxID=1446477 RepID=UPI0025B49901|nr:family 20 glycosylhydrolase [Lutimonas halocynthiae]MDN3643553.1 family 20 glycosylhydrolase [Lutimonas halocynthiae]
MSTKLLLSFLLVFGVFTLNAQESSVSELQLMPWPQEVNVNSSDFKITKDFSIYIHGEVKEDSRIFKASTRFLRYMTDKSGVFVNQGFPNSKGMDTESASLQIGFNEVAKVEMGIDESYTLIVDKGGIKINAATDVGAMHGLSTLLQLIKVNDGAYVFTGVSIEDEPRFVWRGLMMDVARHFMPIEVVKRNIDAMAFVKLNVFHWHLSDDQGFRVELNTLPKLTEMASDGLFYTQDQIRDIVAYADARGIRVVPEFDVPGHGSAFLTAYPELGSKKDIEYSLERDAGIFDPTLDPTNDKTYEFMDTLFKEAAPLFQDVYFHIGGDENEGKHWHENPEIQQFMKENDLKDNHELQTYFNIKLEKILAKYGKSLMGWEEIMTENMPKSALIHSWRGVNEGVAPGQSLVDAVKNGYKTILSNGYYIDLLLSVEDHYAVDPMPAIELTKEEASRILGGEATMWSELVTPLTIDSRIWPRTAAIAERFWSAKEVTDVDSMLERMNSISQSLELMGIQHKKASEYIFRNLANYQDTHALRTLSQISEPFKIYSRNAGGTEYKTYSPFTLFADACIVDAKDVRPFRKAVEAYIKSADTQTKEAVQQYLKTWKGLHEQLEMISPDAPLIATILPYANRVAEISERLLNGIAEGKLTQEQFNDLKLLLESKEDPSLNLDVELAVSKDLLVLATYLAE